MYAAPQIPMTSVRLLAFAVDSQHAPTPRRAREHLKKPSPSRVAERRLQHEFMIAGSAEGVAEHSISPPGAGPHEACESCYRLSPLGTPSPRNPHATTAYDGYACILGLQGKGLQCFKQSWKLFPAIRNLLRPSAWIHADFLFLPPASIFSRSR